MINLLLNVSGFVVFIDWHVRATLHSLLSFIFGKVVRNSANRQEPGKHDRRHPVQRVTLFTFRVRESSTS
jgi:hypothetical protein